MKNILCVDFNEFSNMACAHVMRGQIIDEDDRDGMFCSARDCLDNEPRNEPWPECGPETCPLWRKWKVS